MLAEIAFSDAVILAAVIAAGVKVLADQLGWTRSTALVRQENADLRERNATLTAEVERLDSLDREKAQRIAALEARIEDLQKRDQTAVLDALYKHDLEINEKYDRLAVILEREHELDAARHQESIVVLREIRDGIHPTS